MGATAHGPRCPTAGQRETHVVGGYHHFRKSSRDGSLEKVWTYSIEVLRDQAGLDLSQLNLDGLI
jgi:hypothetical protein